MFGLFKTKKPATYVPPQVLPFPCDYEGVMKTLAPYYKQERPLDFFFEMYVVRVLGRLPTETLSALTEFSAKHPSLFVQYGGDWQQYIVKECHLSNTIETAIWYLWIRNSVAARRDGWDVHPWHYAQLFAQNYFADGSRVDVWEGNALQEAKQRIEEYRKSG